MRAASRIAAGILALGILMWAIADEYHWYPGVGATAFSIIVVLIVGELEASSCEQKNNRS